MLNEIFHLLDQHQVVELCIYQGDVHVAMLLKYLMDHEDTGVDMATRVLLLLQEEEGESEQEEDYSDFRIMK